MDTKKALEIGDGLQVLSEELDIPYGQLTAYICFFKADCRPIFEEIANKYNEFINSDLEDRGKLLGINITVTECEDSRN